jgi:hypothetical protein
MVGKPFVLIGVALGFSIACPVPVPLAIAHPAAAIEVRVDQHRVSPGSRQVVRVAAAPHLPVTLSVLFPNGSGLTAQGSTDMSGGLVWSFVQPRNAITHGSRTAAITVTAGPGSATVSYAIDFAPIDLVVPGTEVRENSRVDLWVHTAPHSPVRLQLLEDRAAVAPLDGRTGPRGWLKVPFTAPTPIGNPMTVSVLARATARGRVVHTRASFQVQEFQFGISIANPQVLHRVAGDWAPTTQVRLGEDVRFGGNSIGTEPAGNFPTCGSGAVRIAQGERTLTTLQLQCTTLPPGEHPYGMEGPYVYADTRFTDPADIGPLQAVIEVAWENARASYTLPFTLVGAASEASRR